MNEPDHAGAQVHRRNAERQYEAADRFMAAGMDDAAEAATAAGKQEDALADMLENPVNS